MPKDKRLLKYRYQGARKLFPRGRGGWTDAVRDFSALLVNWVEDKLAINLRTKCATSVNIQTFNSTLLFIDLKEPVH
jgi:hypothetical protein